MERSSQLLQGYVDHWEKYFERYLQRCAGALGSATRGEFGVKEIVAYTVRTSMDAVDSVRKIPMLWESSLRKLVIKVPQGQDSVRRGQLLQEGEVPATPLSLVSGKSQWDPSVKADVPDLIEANGVFVVTVAISGLAGLSKDKVQRATVKDANGDSLVDIEIEIV